MEIPNTDYQKMADEYLSLRIGLKHSPNYRMVIEFSHGELCVLNYLFTHDGTAYPKELSNDMHVSSARIAALLNQMAKKGWLIRAADTADNRKVLITLTESGQAEILQKRRKVLEITTDMLKSLGPEDAKACLRIQRKLSASGQPLRI